MGNEVFNRLKVKADYRVPSCSTDSTAWSFGPLASSEQLQSFTVELKSPLQINSSSNAFGTDKDTIKGLFKQ